MSYFGDTQYDTEPFGTELMAEVLVEVSSSFRGNPAFQSGEDVIKGLMENCQ